MRYIVSLLMLAVWCAVIVLWIAMLIDAAQTRQWVWFVLSLVFWPTVVLYLLVAYESPKKRRARAEFLRHRNQREECYLKEIARLERELEKLKAAQEKHGRESV